MSKTLPVITFLLGDRVWRDIGSPYNCTAETLFMIREREGRGRDSRCVFRRGRRFSLHYHVEPGLLAGA